VTLGVRSGAIGMANPQAVSLGVRAWVAGTANSQAGRPVWAPAAGVQVV
jgi:hypothetical protein